MFYSKDILTKKKGGFGIIWLAATLGAKSHVKKLSKKDVKSVNVIQACGFLASPPEPLALRLSSNLMVGISRVYNQQYDMYYTEVNNLWQNIRNHLMALESENVTMAVPEARFEAITLSEDFELSGLTLAAEDLYAADFGWIMTLESRRGLVQAAEGSEILPSASSALITVPETPFEGEFSIADIGPGMLSEDILGAEEVPGLVFDFEGNLTIAEGAEVPQMQGFTFDEGELMARVQEEHELRAGVQIPPQRQAQLLERYGVPLETITELTRGPSEIEGDSMLAGVFQEPGQLRRERRGSRFVLRDQYTELAEGEVGWREQMRQDIEQAATETRLKSLRRRNKTEAIRLLNEPSIKNYADEIQDMWVDSVTKKKRLGTSVVSEHKKRQRAGEEIVTRAESRQIPFAEIEVSSIGSRGEMEMEYGEPEVLRALPSDRESIEMARHVMPWNIGYDTSFRRPSSIETESTGVPSLSEREFAPETPWGRRRSSITAASPIGVTTPITMEEFSPLGLAEIGFRETRFGETAYSTIQEGEPTPLIAEGETARFMEYTKSLMRQANVFSIHFSDLIPPQSSRSTASQAFYHILVLASKNLAQVHQVQPYSDITIEFPS
ncbi:R8 protein [Basidiobolus ranarum]|uniref:R8 protein n=1 Tax=Basidiobolus ranarum TaxID=34480 RepID=A0ABR2W3L3_9FUNG